MTSEASGAGARRTALRIETSALPYVRTRLTGAARPALGVDDEFGSRKDPRLQTENDEPQPQVVAALGLRMMNCAPERSSW
jgi:hypothetical protein